MPSGAALHTHDCLDMVTVRGRWVARCRCGHRTIGMTVDSAARGHRAHADYANQLAAYARH